VCFHLFRTGEVHLKNTSSEGSFLMSSNEVWLNEVQHTKEKRREI